MYEFNWKLNWTTKTDFIFTRFRWNQKSTSSLPTAPWSQHWFFPDSKCKIFQIFYLNFGGQKIENFWPRRNFPNFSKKKLCRDFSNKLLIFQLGWGQAVSFSTIFYDSALHTTSKNHWLKNGKYILSISWKVDKFLLYENFSFKKIYEWSIDWHFQITLIYLCSTSF